MISTLTIHPGQEPMAEESKTHVVEVGSHGGQTPRLKNGYLYKRVLMRKKTVRCDMSRKAQRWRDEEKFLAILKKLRAQLTSPSGFIEMSRPGPKCPSCGSDDLFSKGSSWCCKKCGRQWVKYPRGQYTITGTDRPKCPSCGAGDPVSNEPNWSCKKCGRHWLKSPRGRYMISGTDRPQCPSCGSGDPVSKGLAWCCKKCGRSWMKHKLVVEPLIHSPWEVVYG